jgi:PAS domain S-box-containing protein
LRQGPQGAEPTRQTGREELFELVVDSLTDFGIFTVDDSGKVTSWNPGAERLFGYAEAEIMGSSADVIFTPEDRQAEIPARERTEARMTGHAADERWHQRRDGSRFWAMGLLTRLNGHSDGFVKITRDRTAQHRAEEQLRINEERFRLLATSIPQLVFRTRSNGSRTWGSPQWIEFTGLSLEDSLGEGWFDAIHPDDRELTKTAWGEAQERGEYYVEHRIQRAADGEYRWHQTRARPVNDNGSSDDWVGTMTDIHDLRGLKDRQQMLLAELQHRTRNLLAVVQSVASQTLRKSPSLAFFKPVFEDRLRALSRVQTLLARADQGDVELAEVVRGELAAHGEEVAGEDRVEVSGPRVVLRATPAQAIGLAVHELATNALKYGALAQPRGRLSIVWRIVGQGGSREVEVQWRESGVSMPSRAAKPRAGYGTELIERALPYQLGARTRLEFTADGVHCLIAVALEGGGTETPNG